MSSDINGLSCMYGGNHLRQRRVNEGNRAAHAPPPPPDHFRRAVRANWGAGAGPPGRPHQDNKPRYPLPPILEIESERIGKILRRAHV